MTQLTEDTKRILDEFASNSGNNLSNVVKIIQGAFNDRKYGRAVKAHNDSLDSRMRGSIESSLRHDLSVYLGSHKLEIDRPAAMALQSQVRDKTRNSADNQTWLMRLVKSHP